MRLVSGNKMIAEGALAAGCRFFAGYPITPSSEIMEYLAQKMPRIGGKFIQMEDEIASMGAVIGASLAGAKAMTATSGPGFSLMQEHIGYAAMAEVPCVIANVMRSGPSTGLPTKTSQGDFMQARFGSHGDIPAIALVPESPIECFHLTVRAFNLAEEYRTPVVLLSDEVNAHMRENVPMKIELEAEIRERREPEVPPSWYKHYPEEVMVRDRPMAVFGEGYRFHVTGLTHDHEGFPSSKRDQIIDCHTHLVDKVRRNAHRIAAAEKYRMREAKIVIVAAGSAARSAKEAVKMLRNMRIKIGLFRPITMWPFPKKQLQEAVGRKAKAVLVVEQNFGQMAVIVRYYMPRRMPVVHLNQVDGELIEPEKIIAKVTELY
ncbi:MAG: 2-oxoacid:acceptor oxidoreductase subunit alpha [Planctomycetota bacterium]|nr:MAG: 2-oxoacid:acceptor oxidoreductase subunit alpha [Planctomycetota bacterium]